MTGASMMRKRVEAGLSRRDLAKKIGVHEFTVSQWERGQHTPRVKYRRKLAAVLGRKEKPSPTVTVNRKIKEVLCSYLA